MKKVVLVRFVVLIVTLAVGAGCASDEAARRDAERAARNEDWAARHSSIQAASDEEDRSSPDMVVTGEEGTLDAADVESALKNHMGDILDCYRLRRGPTRAYGRVRPRTSRSWSPTSSAAESSSAAWPTSRWA
jgi:hypothetical protein